MCPNGCAAMRAYTSSAAVREIACAAARMRSHSYVCPRSCADAQMRAWGGAQSRPRGCGCAPLPGSPLPTFRALPELVELVELVGPLLTFRALLEPLPSLPSVMACRETD